MLKYLERNVKRYTFAIQFDFELQKQNSEKMTYEEIQTNYNVTREEAQKAFISLLPKIAKIKNEKLGELKRLCFHNAVAASGAKTDNDIRDMARDHVDGELPRLEREAEEASNADVEQLYNQYFRK